MQTAFLELSADLTIREVWRAPPSERFRRKNTGKSARATFSICSVGVDLVSGQAFYRTRYLESSRVFLTANWY